MLRYALSIIGAGLASQVAAEPLNVAADIAPVHSLAARVMDGVGTPDLIIPPGATPHDHAMRPSEARALQSADVVFWTGEELTPWMSKPLGALSGEAQHIALLDADGTVLHEFRDVTDDDHHDEHEDDDPAGHEDDANHDGHTDAEHGDAHDDHGHDHDGIDPHAWLDPENARVWVAVIAETLAAADPQNAQKYRDNARAADAELIELRDRIAGDLADMQARRFITFHDAYQYFEKRFGLETSGSVSLGDASAPGPARLAALQEKVAKDGVACAFVEPQFDTRLVNTAVEGTGAAIYELDPIGVAIEPGADQYFELMRGLTNGYRSCANGS